MVKPKFFDVEQNTDEWYELRSKKVTSSALTNIMANFGKAFGEPAKAYARNIAFERVFGKPAPSGPTTYQMREGHEKEPRACAEYSAQYFLDVENGGFFDCGDFGCSPDGLIVGGGVIEIKSQIPHIHFKTVKSQSFPSAYKWQIAANCSYPEQPFIDCISYCEDVPDERCIYVCRFYREELENDYSMIKERVEEFLETQVKPWVEIIGNSKYAVNVS